MIDGPTSFPQPAPPFDELASLRDVTREILRSAVVSLVDYRDDASGGYFHVLGRDTPTGTNVAGDFSKASTSTVVPFLIRTGRWDDVAGPGHGQEQAQRLLDQVLKGPWTSAGLPPDNPFTVGFLLELAAALRQAGAVLTDSQNAICQQKLAVLRAAVQSPDGRVRIAYPPPRTNEPPNSYLTQLALRVLGAWDRAEPFAGTGVLPGDVVSKAWEAALASVNSEVARLHADPLGADVFELGYAILIVNDHREGRLRPETRQLLRYALSLFFDAQRPDGSWPQGRRLFQYPNYGTAYCFEYEFLAQLMASLADTRVLRPYLANLQRAVDRLTREAVSLPGGGMGWASGHHRQLVYPESWSTASCLDLCHRIDRYVADAITDTIFEHLGQARFAMRDVPSRDDFDKLLDAEVAPPGKPVISLKHVLEHRFARAIAEQGQKVRDGKLLTEDTPRSAILYGPPGTSKTTYATAVSRYIGWDLITIDPSHLLRSGFDGVQLEVNRLFRMLAYAERVVVFFDEIDELVRDRFGAFEEASSRFSTTSMLPRIGRLRDSRQLAFLVATNHIEVFDAAIARIGRFDLVIPVMPPTASEKLRKWPRIKDALERFELMGDQDMLKHLAGLTFGETDALVPSLAGTADKHEFIRAVKDAAAVGTLNQRVTEKMTWLQLMDDQQRKMRLGRDWQGDTVESTPSS